LRVDRFYPKRCPRVAGLEVKRADVSFWTFTSEKSFEFSTGDGGTAKFLLYFKRVGNVK
jgi:hypothetical protein